jgi:alkanesulfonate monooxygenase SsuD/methylene tetrahydromethanopterin reductase-like flavin-dependent oxidoreductase (luciferase family)
MALSYIDDPKHWHIRAEETRILAAPMTDEMSKLSALSQVTEHIGLVATGSTTSDAPYHIARRFASLIT